MFGILFLILKIRLLSFGIFDVFLVGKVWKFYVRLLYSKIGIIVGSRCLKKVRVEGGI